MSTPAETAQSRVVQHPISEEAYRRIKVEASRRLIKMGDVITKLAIEHLPPVEPEQN